MKSAFKISVLLSSLIVCSFSYSQDTTAFDFEAAYKTAVKEYEEFEKTHGHFFQTSNVDMHYSTWGDSTKNPILWVHGTHSNSTEIIDFVDTLVAKDYYVIAIEYYGHGLTPIPDKEVSIYHVVDDINELMVHLSIDKIIIGGLSRGGIIAAAFYDQHPTKVTALILEDGGSASFLAARQSMEKTKIEQLYAEMYSSGNDTTFTSRFEAFSYYYNPRWTDSQYWWFAFLRKNDTDLWALNPNLSKWLGQRGENAGVRNIYQTTQAPLFESSTLLLMPEIVFRNLHVPMLIFDPQKDDENGLFALTEANKKLKSQHSEFITLKHYPDSNHPVHFDQPERFVVDLLDFLERVKQVN
ncbi:MAG: pimeloyl-ACP methyl ester carboxylesterase [Flavobacteriaceae bacterium]|jgi:pimeloyl-ACP methyl ester carboxylesterase